MSQRWVCCVLFSVLCVPAVCPVCFPWMPLVCVLCASCVPHAPGIGCCLCCVWVLFITMSRSPAPALPSIRTETLPPDAYTQQFALLFVPFACIPGLIVQCTSHFCFVTLMETPTCFRCIRFSVYVCLLCTQCFPCVLCVLYACLLLTIWVLGS